MQFIHTEFTMKCSKAAEQQNLDLSSGSHVHIKIMAFITSGLSQNPICHLGESGNLNLWITNKSFFPFDCGYNKVSDHSKKLKH